jgi:hypothetical protein
MRMIRNDTRANSRLTSWRPARPSPLPSPRKKTRGEGVSAFIALLLLLAAGSRGAAPATSPSHAISVRTVDDYVFGDYQGTFTSPPSADNNPRRAVIISWRDFRYRLVFCHEASYCPWLEFPSGAAVCFQFFEGNDGVAELFNQFGRQEKNSFVEVVKTKPDEIHIRWTYFGVNQTTAERYYRATEDFFAQANGQIVRRQSYESLKPADPHGYAREPIELIGLCPVGQTWRDILRRADEKSEARHALAALDPFSDKRYDVYWTPKPAALIQATARRTGCSWKELDDAAGIVLALPLRDGTPFVAFGTASGFDASFTRIKDHSFTDTGGIGWLSQSWDHWPIGWLNSQAHEVDAASLQKYPNHFSPAGMDFFALANEEVAKREYWSLIAVASGDIESTRRVARQWLESRQH